MKNNLISQADLAKFNADGYLKIAGLFSDEEAHKLCSAAINDVDMQNNALDLNDQSGKKTRLSLWFNPGNDIFGYMVRSKRIVDRVATFLGGQAAVSHYHSKLMQKEPHVGGAWEWHQDYGYWYKNQFMFPDQLLSVMVALTPSTRENGCLQVIKGSHRIGRVNHGFAGEQVGADMTMVENALKTMELVYAELNPGDALFFHSNLLHRSAANLSENARWSIISCYSLTSNTAYNENSQSYKIPLEVVPDEAVLCWKSESSSSGFLKKEEDPALKETGWESKVNAIKPL